MNIPDITRSEVFTALQKYPFTSTVLRKIFGRFEANTDDQSVNDLERFVQTPDSEVNISGYVVHTLEAALWAFFSTYTFQEEALKVINLGDDADTASAVYGGLSGAWYGNEAISNARIQGLQAKGMLDEVARGMVKLIEKGG